MRSCLIVDESAIDRQTVVEAVRGARHGIMEFHEADGAVQALQLFDAHRPDVVFVDMALAADEGPAKDGRAAMGRGVLRALLARSPSTPVVVMTGILGPQPEVVEAISLGAIAALRKPVKPEEVKFVLGSIEPDKPSMDYFG